MGEHYPDTVGVVGSSRPPANHLTLLEATIGIRRSKAPNKQDDSIRVNDQIAQRIRLIDGEGGQVGVITVADA